MEKARQYTIVVALGRTVMLITNQRLHFLWNDSGLHANFIARSVVAVPRSESAIGCATGATPSAAAPAGGARFLRGRGCVFQACVLAMTMMQAAVPAMAQRVDIAIPAVPSGQALSLMEVIADDGMDGDVDGGIVHRFRFLAPDLASPLTRPSFEVLTADIEALCAEFAVPYLQESNEEAARVVVSLSAEPVVFGQVSPEIVQVFEAFSLDRGTCILEMF